MELMVERFWLAYPSTGMPQGLAEPLIPLVPTANHGRWVIGCPRCPTAALASRVDPRFFCVGCGNFAFDGKWATVAWHPAWQQVDRLLSARRVAATQNWELHESVDALAVENLEHWAA